MSIVWSAVLSLSWLIAGGPAGSGDPAAVKYAPHSREIQALLEVPLTGRESLTLMEQYVARRLAGTPVEALDPLLLRFAKSVVDGVEPGLLGYVDRVDVRSAAWFVHAKNADQRTGSVQDSLERRLLKLAGDNFETSPETARALARALIVLKSHDRIRFFGSFPLKAGDHPLYDVAGLTPAQQSKIRELETRLRQKHTDCIPYYKVTSDILMSLIESPTSEELWKQSVPEFVKQLKAGWAKADEVLMVRFALATHSWRLVCLARHHRIETLEPALRAAVDELKQQTADPVALRWLDEIFTMPGGPPKDSGVRVVTNPNERKPGRP